MPPDAERGEIVIAVDLDRPELAGRVSTVAGGEQPFVSWLGLLAVLDAATRALRRDAG